MLPATNRYFRGMKWKATGSLGDRKSTRLNSSHSQISYAVFCLKKKKEKFSYYVFGATNISTPYSRHAVSGVALSASVCLFTNRPCRRRIRQDASPVR